MKFERQKAIMLAETIHEFIKYVRKSHENKNSFRFNIDKLYQVNLLVEEYKFQMIADELMRINQYSWDGKYTYYLVDGFKKGIDVIDDYVRNNYEELYLLTARLYPLKDLLQLFNRIETETYA
ncbi:hypothetical protein L1999_11070 [Neobacillus drentensis]|uniref:hypothetical protein n=1 Tax=Neobacillus drentensis TaxID=220684 RepID=UPI001F416C34|nr:hypothetical protein [Neobacillus drentensis]ULT59026.1 hypothetical protein L1999_11070 [Neobacillus drentensis]